MKKFICICIIFILSQPAWSVIDVSDPTFQETYAASTESSGAASRDSLIILAVGAVLATVLLIALPKNRNREQEFLSYMKQNRKNITRDFNLGRGSFFSDIAYELNMTPQELAVWEESLEGSVHQRKALQILSEKLTTKKLAPFSSLLLASLLDALGKQRTYSLLKGFYA